MKQMLGYLSPDADGKDAGGGKADDRQAGDKGAGDKAGTEKTVTLTQAQLDAMVNDAFGRGAGKVLGKLGVKTEEEGVELLAVGRKAKEAPAPKDDKGGSDDIQKRIDAAVAGVRTEFEKQLTAKDEALAKSQQAAQRFAVDNAITFAAAKKQVVNTDHVVQLLRGRCRISADGTAVEVLDERGNVSYGKDGKPLAVEVFVEDWLTANPHFLPAGVKPGAGGGNSPGGSSNAKTITRAEFEQLPPAEKARVLKDPALSITG